MTNQWLNHAVFYEIYPQSFCDSNGDGIGDIQGIISKLDYIEELGCNAIWMNPCFDSPFVDAGYDVRDYYKVAPRYGTNEDLKQLFIEAHQRNMHVILDLVPGHTSIESDWFKQSCKAEKNAYTDRYIWSDTVWNAPVGVGSITGWYRGGYDRDGAAALNFFTAQPALNYGFYEKDEGQDWQQDMNDAGPLATRDEIKNIMRFWCGLGCDGFRVDMAGSLVKNDPDKAGTIALWKDVSGFLKKEFPEAVMVSEWGEPDKALEAGFDMEIVEKHHNLKLDAPSGTALALADSMNEALDNEYHYVYDRSQVRKQRDPKEIGISAVRGGNIVGEHEVLFCGQDEVIEFKHTAYSKAVFAKGAVEAAKFLKGKAAGHYDMADVIAAK